MAQLTVDLLAALLNLVKALRKAVWTAVWMVECWVELSELTKAVYLVETTAALMVSL